METGLMQGLLFAISRSFRPENKRLKWKREGSSGGEQPRTFNLHKEPPAFPIKTRIWPVNDACAHGLRPHRRLIYWTQAPWRSNGPLVAPWLR